MIRYPSGIEVSTYIGMHLGTLGLLSWISGQPFLIPSLGPSIYLLATLPDAEMNYPRRIIAGQFIGAVAGFASFHLLVGNVETITTSPAVSLVVLRQVLSSFTAAVLTTVGMYLTETQHPPAYATTLIVSLGLITAVTEIIFFLIATLVMVGMHEIVGKRLSIWNLPYEHDT
jgi:CBS-domain-containing membrane protein